MTKIKIIFEDENITIRTPKSFKLKLLLDMLYRSLNIDPKTHRLEIFTTGAFFNNSDTLTPKENQQFYLISIEEPKPVIKPKVSLPMDQLISNITGSNILPRPGVVQREREIEGSFMEFLRAHGFRIIRLEEGNSSSDDESEDERGAEEVRDISRALINRMIEIGMDEQRAIYCLYHSRNNLDVAVNYYFAHSDVEFDDMDGIVSLVNIIDGEPPVRQNNQQRRVVQQMSFSHIPQNGNVVINNEQVQLPNNNPNNLNNADNINIPQQGNPNNPFLVGLNRQNRQNQSQQNPQNQQNQQNNSFQHVMNFLIQIVGAPINNDSDSEDNI
jgi:hypothetical protein